MKSLKGMGVALVTPFKEDGSVDVKALEKIVNYQIRNKADYLVVLGTTGEYVTLTAEERALIKQTIVTVNDGQLPLVLGIGGNNTAEVARRLQTEDYTAFDAVLSVSPYYNKPSQEGIYQHFSVVAEQSKRPVIVYNVPGRTASNMTPETVARLAADCENIVGIKEAAGDMVQAMEMIAQTPDDFLVISGDDMLALPMTLAGGAGVISVIGQGFPKEFAQMIALGLQGNAQQAYAIHYKMAEVIDLIFEEGNPVGIKAVLHKLALAEVTVRLPLVTVSQSLHKRINKFTDSL